MAKNEQSYFLLTLSEDGEVFFERFIGERLIAKINHSISQDGLKISDFVEDAFVLPKEAYCLSDGFPDGKSYIIIKGGIFTPKPVEVIQRVSLDE